MELLVLRLGHRAKRDVRLTTHCCLTARALGADGIVLSGEKDESVMESVLDVTERWGGTFTVAYEKNWRKWLESKKKEGWKVAHLTMYGLPVQDVIPKLRKDKKLILMLGGAKVPGEAYALADYNIGVTNQPHSEVAALAVTLHELFNGKELNKKFLNAQVIVKPNPRGKTVIKQD